VTLEGEILLVVRREPGLSCAEICRRLNGKTLDDCVLRIRCKYYLNPRRRSSLFGVGKPPCRWNYQRVRRALRRLARRGLVELRRELRGDRRNERGYDYFLCAYPAFNRPHPLPPREGAG